ncbi:MAG TPA: hypothetical protein VLL54_16985 [Pyrinomonadaceae bacterium]|nr:hypothetical protein [Pyrinomonadaceae bacterium]
MTETTSGIKRGAAVVIVLHTPREKFWGLVDDINSAGVFCRGLDLNSFDDWLSSLVHSEPFMGVGDVFFPMWRIERIARDETAGGVPSLSDQVEKRTGGTVVEALQFVQDN